MATFRELVEQDPNRLVGRTVAGLPGTPNPVKIRGIEVHPWDPSKVKIEAIDPQAQRFFEPILSLDDLGGVEIVPEYTFTGDPQGFFMNMMGRAIRSNFNQDPLFAVGSSKIDPLPHQLEAVYKYALPRPQIRFMIADEPGAGKTIMAGLLLKELLSRGDVQRVLIVVPGSLTGQWRLEMKTRFNEDCDVVNSDSLRSHGPRVWRDFPKVITSMDFAKNEVQKKRKKGRREIRNSLLDVPWDFVIVDEAHKMNAAWDAKQQREDVTQRYRLGRVLSANAEHLLFLTATPHQGKSDNFRLLLKLLEPDSFDDPVAEVMSVLDQFQEVGYPVFVRRMKEEMVTEENKPMFPDREAITLEFSLTPVETVLYKEVSQYVKNTFNLAKNIGGARGASIGFMLKLLQRRLNSSVRAIHRTLVHRKTKLEEILNNPDFDRSVRELRAEIEKLTTELQEAEANDDVSPKEVETLQQRIFALTMASNPAELAKEIDVLGDLVRAAATAEQQQVEAKLTRLLAEIDRRLGAQQLIIFTEYKDTLDYLEEKIPPQFHVGTIHGGMDLQERAKVQAKFWGKEIQILLCTDAASEGINLQCCWNLINYDIPWNPNRLEQRMGRIHRYLQRHKCVFFNLVATSTADGEEIVEGMVVQRIFEKLEIMRRELGGTDRVFDVINAILEEWHFSELLEQSLQSSPQDLSTQLAEMDGEKLRDLVDFKSNVDVGLEFFLKQRQKSEDTRLWPKYIAAYVQAGLRMAGRGIPPFKGEGPFKIQVPPKLRAQARQNRGRYGDLPGSALEVTFTKPTERQLVEAMTGTSEYVTAGHPLLEAIIDVATREGEEAFQRGVVLLDPSHGLHGLVWFLVVRFTDGSGLKDISRRVVLLFTPFQDSEVSGESRPEVQPLSPLLLWDFILDYSKSMLVDLSPYQDFFEQYQDYLVQGIGAGLCTEEEGDLKEWRAKAKSIKLAALDRREVRERARLEAEISRLLDKEADGEDVTDQIADKEAARVNIQTEIAELKRRVERDCTVIKQSPQLLSVAVVVPTRPNGHPAESLEEARALADTHSIDVAAMAAVVEFERARGWNPVDKHLVQCGYDIESRDPADPLRVRHIEVKGHDGEEDVFISENEWIKAQNDVRGRYWLYIVNRARTNPEVVPIADPASKFDPREIVSRKYVIPLKQIKDALEIE